MQTRMLLISFQNYTHVLVHSFAFYLSKKTMSTCCKTYKNYKNILEIWYRYRVHIVYMVLYTFCITNNQTNNKTCDSLL